MKIINTILLTIFTVTISFSQLYVKDNSYLYNNGSVVYVTSNVNLSGANSNFYLRNEGQLLQGGTTVGGANSGIGNLSVFQKGTSSNYVYNYWCSPVGVPAAATGNNVFGITQLKRPTDKTNFDTPTIVSTPDGSTTSSLLTISSRWIYNYVALNGYSNWNFIGSASTINPGEGFTMKGVSGTDATAIASEAITANNTGNNQRYNFIGKPNDGNINIAVANAAGQYENSTLTGNPYPSAINLNEFLLENSGYVINYSTGAYTSGGPINVIDGKAYFWEQNKTTTSHVLTNYIGGYGYYVPNGATAFNTGTYNAATWNTYYADGSLNTTGSSTASTYSRMFSPIGQGFMIIGTVTSGNAVMKNLYRSFTKESSGNSHFERNTNNTISSGNWDEIPNVANVDYTQFSKAEVPQIKIHTILNNQFTREVTLAFNPNSTDEYDNAMDAASIDDLPNDNYFSLPNNAKPFVVSTIPFDINKRLPFTFKVTDAQTTFKVAVGNIINFTGSSNVYLYDNQTGIYHDIVSDFYEVTLPTGVYANQYQITFRNDSALSNNHSIKDSLTVLQNNSTETLTVYNLNSLDMKSVVLYDITGKQIFNKANLGTKSTYEFSTASLAEGVYLVKLFANDGQTLGQKIIVERVK